MLSSKLTALATMAFMGVAPVMSSGSGNDIYVKFVNKDAAPFYKFYPASDCASGEILPNQQPCPSESCKLPWPLSA